MGPRRSARIVAATKKHQLRSQSKSTCTHSSDGILKTNRKTLKTPAKATSSSLDSTSTIAKRFDLFKLPGEIRNLIYKEALGKRDSIPLVGPLPALLHTSIETRGEAIHWYYHENVFKIFLHLQVVRLSRLTQKLEEMSRDGTLQSLKHVELHLEGYSLHGLVKLLPFVHLLRSLPFDTTASSWQAHSDYGLDSDSWLKVKIINKGPYTTPPFLKDVVEGLVADGLNMANRARDEGWLSAELDMEYNGGAYFHPNPNNLKMRKLQALRKNRDRLRPRVATIGGGSRAC